MKEFIKLNKDQIAKLSDISSDIGLIAVASVVLPAVFDRVDPQRVILGLLMAFLFWSISLIIRKNP